MFLYVITNLVNGKQYVGIAANPEQRRREHYSGHGSKLVWQAIRKYGRENLDFEVWYEGDEEWIKLMEYRAIVKVGTRAPQGYNLTLGGEGSFGWRPSAETLAKFRQRRNGMKGRKHTAETRQKIRAKAIGRKPHPKALRILTDTAGPKNPRARPVTVDGVAYGCIKDAALAGGFKVSTLYARLRGYTRSGLWPVGWGFKAPV